MIKVSEFVDEMDLGDQIILDLQGKTLGMNRTGREIYLKVKEGKTVQEVEAYMKELFGGGRDYMSDIEAYIRKLETFGVITREGKNG